MVNAVKRTCAETLMVVAKRPSPGRPQIPPDVDGAIMQLIGLLFLTGSVI